ncbi:hypothetical protein [Flavobacterium alkalisoli]|uniref:hypothetical protein n=1 Tax=Flavobacterium alkalisoli TaxID=2602769 RepID=UPI003A8DBDE7
MMIKKSLIVFLFIASVLTAKAQEASKCEEAIAAFEAVVKSGNYDEALGGLKDLIKECPKADEKLYMFAEVAYVYKIESAQDKKSRQEFIDGLFALYDNYNKNFPAAKNRNAIKKAQLQYDQKLESEDKIFEAFDKAFTQQSHDFTGYKELEAYYSLYLKRFENGKANISTADFMSKFGDVSAQVIYAKNKILAKKSALLVKKETEPLTEEEKEFLASAKNDLDALTAVGENVDRLSSKHFSCEGLEEFYTAKFEKNKENADWLEALVNVMFLNRCYNSAVLEKGAHTLYELRPSVQSAFNMANIALRKNNTQEAVMYFDKAAQMEKNPEERADINYKIAGVFRNTDKAKAKEYTFKVMKDNPKDARPYIFLAEMYSSVTRECDVTEFERKALLWLAIDTAKKAEGVDPKYKRTVDSMVQGYEKRLPTADEMKEAGKRKGDEIKYGCWINETVTLPKIK